MISAKKGHRLGCPFCLQLTPKIAAGEWEEIEFLGGGVYEALALIPLPQLGVLLDDTDLHLGETGVFCPRKRVLQQSAADILVPVLRKHAKAAQLTFLVALRKQRVETDDLTVLVDPGDHEPLLNIELIKKPVLVSCKGGEARGVFCGQAEFLRNSEKALSDDLYTFWDMRSVNDYYHSTPHFENSPLISLQIRAMSSWVKRPSVKLTITRRGLSRS